MYFLSHNQGRFVLTSTLGDVAHPWQRLVTTLLYDLEVAHLTSRSRFMKNITVKVFRLQKLHNDTCANNDENEIMKLCSITFSLEKALSGNW